MTAKQHKIITLTSEGKSAKEICTVLGITAANLYSTLYQMRRRGLIARKESRALPVLSAWERMRQLRLKAILEPPTMEDPTFN